MAFDLIDPHKCGHSMGPCASGTTIVGSLVNEGPVGFTCEYFCSVSVDRSSISFCVVKKTTSRPKFRSAGKLSINILSWDQRELSDKFSCPGAECWADVDWANELNNPAIADVLLCLDCSLFAEPGADDHWITIGKVDRLVATDKPNHLPLLYYKIRTLSCRLP